MLLFCAITFALIATETIFSQSLEKHYFDGLTSEKTIKFEQENNNGLSETPVKRDKRFVDLLIAGGLLWAAGSHIKNHMKLRKLAKEYKETDAYLLKHGRAAPLGSDYPMTTAMDDPFREEDPYLNGPPEEFHHSPYAPEYNRNPPERNGGADFPLERHPKVFHQRNYFPVPEEPIFRPPPAPNHGFYDQPKPPLPPRPHPQQQRFMLPESQIPKSQPLSGDFPLPPPRVRNYPRDSPPPPTYGRNYYPPSDLRLPVPKRSPPTPSNQPQNPTYPTSNFEEPLPNFDRTYLQNNVDRNHYGMDKDGPSPFVNNDNNSFLSPQQEPFNPRKPEGKTYNRQPKMRRQNVFRKPPRKRRIKVPRTESAFTGEDSAMSPARSGYSSSAGSSFGTDSLASTNKNNKNKNHYYSPPKARIPSSPPTNSDHGSPILQQPPINLNVQVFPPQSVQEDRPVIAVERGGRRALSPVLEVPVEKRLDYPKKQKPWNDFERAPAPVFNEMPKRQDIPHRRLRERPFQMPHPAENRYDYFSRKPYVPVSSSGESTASSSSSPYVVKNNVFPKRQTIGINKMPKSSTWGRPQPPQPVESQYFRNFLNPNDHPNRQNGFVEQPNLPNSDTLAALSPKQSIPHPPPIDPYEGKMQPHQIDQQTIVRDPLKEYRTGSSRLGIQSLRPTSVSPKTRRFRRARKKSRRALPRQSQFRFSGRNAYHHHQYNPKTINISQPNKEILNNNNPYGFSQNNNFNVNTFGRNPPAFFDENINKGNGQRFGEKMVENQLEIHPEMNNNREPQQISLNPNYSKNKVNSARRYPLSPPPPSPIQFGTKSQMATGRIRNYNIENDSLNFFRGVQSVRANKKRAKKGRGSSGISLRKKKLKIAPLVRRQKIQKKRKEVEKVTDVNEINNDLYKTILQNKLNAQKDGGYGSLISSGTSAEKQRNQRNDSLITNFGGSFGSSNSDPVKSEVGSSTGMREKVNSPQRIPIGGEANANNVGRPVHVTTTTKHVQWDPNVRSRARTPDTEEENLNPEQNSLPKPMEEVWRKIHDNDGKPIPPMLQNRLEAKKSALRPHLERFKSTPTELDTHPMQATIVNRQNRLDNFSLVRPVEVKA